MRREMIRLVNGPRKTRPHVFPARDTLRDPDHLQMPTVLLAEDDDNLRCVMECALTAMGCTVIACADAQLASVAFRSHQSIDALLTDFWMPGETGLELARELTTLSPTLPVMMITGSTPSMETIEEIDERGWLYVKKPCNLVALREIVDWISKHRAHSGDVIDPRTFSFADGKRRWEQKRSSPDYGITNDSTTQI